MPYNYEEIKLSNKNSRNQF
uniref:Uncharacterized protein n=1 Tax=Heterorhabditis bacteriophora TaxID=37862 RepID=A0A1I7WYK6_HETBA